MDLRVALVGAAIPECGLTSNEIYPGAGGGGVLRAGGRGERGREGESAEGGEEAGGGGAGVSRPAAAPRQQRRVRGGGFRSRWKIGRERGRVLVSGTWIHGQAA